MAKKCYFNIEMVFLVSHLVIMLRGLDRGRRRQQQRGHHQQPRQPHLGRGHVEITEVTPLLRGRSHGHNCHEFPGICHDFYGLFNCRNISHWNFSSFSSEQQQTRERERERERERALLCRRLKKIRHRLLKKAKREWERERRWRRQSASESNKAVAKTLNITLNVFRR